MFGQYYHGDYVFRNILNTPPKIGPGNLGQFDPDIEAKKMDEITRMIDELEGKSAQVRELVDSTQPGIATDVSIWGILSWKGGPTAQKYLNMRDSANALYEKANSLIRSYEQAAITWAAGQIDIGAMRVYHQKFVEMITEYNKFLGIVEEASKQRREHPTGEPKGFFDEIKSLLILGLIGYAAVKYGPDIIKSFKK
jgi:hypothetical protein